MKTTKSPPKRKKGVNKCKCCNNALGENVIFIYDEAGKDLNIEFLLFDSIGKQTSEEDGLHQAICDVCLTQLIQTYAFKQKCLMADCENSEEDISDDEEDADADILYEASDTASDENQEILLLNLIKEENANMENVIEHLEDDNMEEEYLDYQDDMIPFIDANNKDDSSMIENDDENDMLNVKSVNFSSSKTAHQQIGGDPHTQEEKSTLYAPGSELSKMKEKIKSGIPRHSIEKESESRSLDVDKIMTSDDLMNILEDDYQSESGSKRIRLEDIDGEFAIPKLTMCEDIEYLDGHQPTNTDEYLNSIVSKIYSEDEPYEYPLECRLCHDKMATHHGMIFHISQFHQLKENNLYQCIFSDCELFPDIESVGEHIFTDHFELLPTKMCLTCQTCDTVFQSSVQFGKHMCLMLQSIDEGEENFQCLDCDKKLTSRKRFLFHKQFHLKNARPKICIICEKTFLEEEKFYNHVMFSHETLFEHFCEKCDKSFSSKFLLDRHLKVHGVPQSFDCTKCDKSFQDKDILDEHNRNEHATSDHEKILKCHICDKVYGRPSRLRKHLTSHEKASPNVVVTCEECFMVFLNEEKAVDHCERHHAGSPTNIKEFRLTEAFCCEFCENAFYDIDALMKHKKKHKGTMPFKCDTCTSKYDSFSKLKTHKHSHQNQNVPFPIIRKYVCDVVECLKPYRHWSDLTNHRKTVHLINPSIFKCNKCVKTFYQSWKFNYHNKTVHGKSVQCDICNVMLPSNISHKAHMRKHLRGEAKSTAEPKKPGQKRKSNLDLNAYIREEDGSMFCTVCDKKMLSRNNAKTHVEIVHLKIRNFTCKVCEKSFYLRKDYEDHLRLHTAETPFKCNEPLCGKSFRTSSFLSEHRKIHTENRPYKCPYCSSAFKRSYVMKTHMKQHLGIRGFPCKYDNCSKEYRTQWELNFHIRKKHYSIDPKKCSFDNCNAEFSKPRQLDIHYKNKHNCSPTAENAINKTPAAKRKTSKAKKQSTIPKIIYVLPGPVTESEIQDDCAEGAADTDFAVEHNYQAKRAEINIEASNSPKFVYVVGSVQERAKERELANLKMNSSNDLQILDMTETLDNDSADETTLPDNVVFDIIEEDYTYTEGIKVEYLFEQ